MRRVTITIEFLTDARTDEIAEMAGAAQVQILEPVDAEGERAEFTTAEVVTTIINTAV